MSTIRRFTSCDGAAFEVPGEREVDWRFTPLKRLDGLHNGTAVASDSDLYAQPGDAADESPVSVQVVPSGHVALGRALAPADRVAAQAWSAFNKALLVTTPGEADVDKQLRLNGVAVGSARPDGAGQ